MNFNPISPNKRSGTSFVSTLSNHKLALKVTAVACGAFFVIGVFATFGFPAGMVFSILALTTYDLLFSRTSSPARLSPRTPRGSEGFPCYVPPYSDANPPVVHTRRPSPEALFSSHVPVGEQTILPNPLTFYEGANWLPSGQETLPLNVMPGQGHFPF